VERIAEASVSGIFSISEGNVATEGPSMPSGALPGRRPLLSPASTPADPATPSADASRRNADLSADAFRIFAGAGQTPSQPTRASRDEAWLKDYAQGRPADAAFAEDPASAWLVFQGTRIPVVTREALNSDLPGQVTALSTAPVFDSIRQCAVLIPQGARFIGQYSSDIRAGQSRMLLAFRRMILPDGRSVQLAGSPAVDQAGQSGAAGDIDNHFLQMFGYGFAIAWIADRLGSGGSAVTVTQPNGQSTSTTVAGQVLADTSTRILNRNAVIPPTLTVDAGSRMFVTVTRDLALNPVSKGACL
jgi:type IV secretion system protein VirB10